MKLSDYIKPLTEVERRRLAASCGTSFFHLRNVAFSGKPCGLKLAVDIERETAGQVRRWDTRPHDWHEIWPELVGAEGAPEPTRAARFQEARDAA